MLQQCTESTKNLHLIFRTLMTYKENMDLQNPQGIIFLKLQNREIENSIFNIAAHLKFTMQNTAVIILCILQNPRHEFTNLNKVSTKRWQHSKHQSSFWKKKINQNFKTNLKTHQNMNQSAKNVPEAKLASNYTSHC